jgi:uncharacterized membrane protein
VKSLLDKAQSERIVAAIGEAEKRTSGEIRVHLHHKKVEDPIAAGRAVFEKLGMAGTELRNGVLIFVAPRSKNFAILGDSGIHAKCGDDFWSAVAEKMSDHFGRGEFAEGIAQAVAEAGEQLGRHFPRARDDVNELPDEIDEG